MNSRRTNPNPDIEIVIASEVARRSRSKLKAKFLSSFGTSSAISSFRVKIAANLLGSHNDSKDEPLASLYRDLGQTRILDIGN